jgi:hypothetical protein
MAVIRALCRYWVVVRRTRLTCVRSSLRRTGPRCGYWWRLCRTRRKPCHRRYCSVVWCAVCWGLILFHAGWNEDNNGNVLVDGGEVERAFSVSPSITHRACVFRLRVVPGRMVKMEEAIKARDFATFAALTMQGELSPVLVLILLLLLTCSHDRQQSVPRRVFGYIPTHPVHDGRVTSYRASTDPLQPFPCGR